MFKIEKLDPTGKYLGDGNWGPKWEAPSAPLGEPEGYLTRELAEAGLEAHQRWAERFRHRGAGFRIVELAGDLSPADRRRNLCRLALAAGIRDVGYPTVANGFVSSYDGTAEIVLPGGEKLLAVGHPPRGTAAVIFRQGYIEFKAA